MDAGQLVALIAVLTTVTLAQVAMLREVFKHGQILGGLDARLAALEKAIAKIEREIRR